MESMQSGQPVAIIGIAGRFPGARSVGELWELLKHGREMVSPWSDAHLRAAGVSDELLNDPHYVKSGTEFPGVDLFDAEFFGYSPAQAAAIDPQQRHFLECAWEALEDAGYDSERYRGPIGVFAGSGLNQYALAVHLGSAGQMLARQQAVIDSEKDFLATRASYKMGLTGPGITVQTACSTSLVAIHLGCQSLLNFECDIALAGGVTIKPYPNVGYLHVPGGIYSSDGHCRTFDAAGDGTIGSSGVGIVVLKRLEDALEDADHIYAVIRGTAVNNDGAAKVGFTAPGVRGQAQLIASAHAIAGVQPSEISYIEAHGTATVLGDSVELTALREAFQRANRAGRFCALGSIKSNIGHVDAAAGVAGLIKVALCLKHQALVPSLNLRTPNPLIASEDSPFFVNTEFRHWSAHASTPRIAGVSSFGLGGTNAHAVLEEPPEVPRPLEPEEAELFVLSARSSEALRSTTQNLHEFLSRTPDLRATDVAHTLQIGRRQFSHRRFVVARGIEELIGTLRADDTTDDEQIVPSELGTDRPVVFLFPGQGPRYAGIAAQLYESDPLFRKDLDACAVPLAAHLGKDVRSILCDPHAIAVNEDEDMLTAQPALFAFEYCVARLWMRWGVRPAAVIGHSLGEYAAACVAEICSVEDAAALVAKRAQLLHALPDGAMVAVALSESDALSFLVPGLSIAAVNAPSQCVISGALEPIEACLSKLREQQVEHRRVAVSRPAHSAMVEPSMHLLAQAAAGMQFRRPRLPLISTQSGRTVTESNPITAQHWADHLRQPVRFAAALAHTEHPPGTIFLEIGPGETLINLARRQLSRAGNFVFCRSASAADGFTRRSLLHTLGTLWLHGASISSSHLVTQRPRRVSLPTYPFERASHWMLTPNKRETLAQPIAGEPARLSANDRFYVPGWRACLASQLFPKDACRSFLWVVLAEPHGLGQELARMLKTQGAEVLIVVRGAEQSQSDASRLVLDPAEPTGYRSLIETLPGRAAGRPVRILHCWTITDTDPGASRAAFDRFCDQSWSSLLHIAQAVHRAGLRSPVSLYLVTNGLYCLPGDRTSLPIKAPAAALCKVISQEIPNISCAVVDLADDHGRYAAQIINEAVAGSSDRVIAYRAGQRFVQSYARITLPAASERAGLVDRGVYVISGGLGRWGLILGRWLAHKCRARLVLITRSALPAGDDLNRLPDGGEAVAAAASRLEKLRDIEREGGEVFIAEGDVADPQQLGEALHAAESRFGPIRGVFHLAAETRHCSVSRPIEDLEPEDFCLQAKPKVHGFHALEEALAGRDLDFAIAFSSNASVLGGFGFGAYAAANAFLDHAAADQWSRGRLRWRVINWDGWRAVASAEDPFALAEEEALDALQRVLASASTPQIIVSATPLEERLHTWVTRTAPVAASGARERAAPQRRGARAQSRTLPRNDLERTIAAIWTEVLGVEDIGVEERFLELGGDSLIGLRVLARLRERFNVRLAPGSLFGLHSTIAGLAVALVAELARSRDAPVIEATIAGAARAN